MVVENGPSRLHLYRPRVRSRIVPFSIPSSGLSSISQDIGPRAQTNLGRSPRQSPRPPLVSRTAVNVPNVEDLLALAFLLPGRGWVEQHVSFGGMQHQIQEHLLRRWVCLQSFDKQEGSFERTRGGRELVWIVASAMTYRVGRGRGEVEVKMVGDGAQPVTCT